MISPLLTDLYQFTMAYGYWKLGIHDRKAVFQLIFRKNPFQSNYAIACGLATVIDFLKDWHFADDDLEYLQTLYAANGKPLFTAEFLDYLRQLRFECDVDAIPEGTLVFAQEPLIRITGPLLQCQLLESTLLNIINFQTLIATKASRVYQAAQGDPVLEFGMRRAQGPDGALSASRAAYIGGCAATSNVLAGKLYGIPVQGTHAHSWVTAFPDEQNAFAAYAKVMPHNCILLVDTYNTLQGVKNAIATAEQLHKQGAELFGIRLDSGDMVELSIEARKLLDTAGLTKTKIIASNCLDENIIVEMKRKGARVDMWGVGTNLVTAYDQPALDGVYKLSALQDGKGRWQYKLKLSEQTAKISTPGIYQVRRFFSDDQQVMDIMYDLDLGISETPFSVSIGGSHKVTQLLHYDAFVDLLQPVFREGNLVYQQESIHDIRERTLQQLAQFLQSMGSTAEYPVELEKKLHELKQKLISEVSISS